jgi:hypothetical protein
MNYLKHVVNLVRIDVLMGGERDDFIDLALAYRKIAALVA